MKNLYLFPQNYTQLCRGNKSCKSEKEKSLENEKMITTLLSFFPFWSCSFQVSTVWQLITCPSAIFSLSFSISNRITSTMAVFHRFIMFKISKCFKTLWHSFRYLNNKFWSSTVDLLMSFAPVMFNFRLYVSLLAEYNYKMKNEHNFSL